MNILLRAKSKFFFLVYDNPKVSFVLFFLSYLFLKGSDSGSGAPVFGLHVASLSLSSSFSFALPPLLFGGVDMS